MKIRTISAISASCLLAIVEPAWAQVGSQQIGQIINQQQEAAKHSTDDLDENPDDKLHKPQDPNTVPVTFEVPLDLSQIAPQISHVIVSCSVTLQLSGHQPPMGVARIRVVNGGIARTASVIVRLPQHSQVGETAAYTCRLEGFSPTLNGSTAFLANHTLPEFRLAPTPAPLTGTFPWN